MVNKSFISVLLISCRSSVRQHVTHFHFGDQDFGDCICKGLNYCQNISILPPGTPSRNPVGPNLCRFYHLKLLSPRHINIFNRLTIYKHILKIEIHEYTSATFYK